MDLCVRMDYFLSRTAFHSLDAECGGISQDCCGWRASPASETNLHVITSPKAPTCAGVNSIKANQEDSSLISLLSLNLKQTEPV